MGDFIHLSCIQCGGQLSHNKETDEYECENCSSKYLLKKTDKGIEIEKIIRSVSNLPNDIKKNNAELAITRLEKEIAILNHEKAQINANLAALGTATCSVIALPVLIIGAVLSSASFCVILLLIGAIGTSIKENPIPWIIGVVVFIFIIVIIIWIQRAPRRKMKARLIEIDDQINKRVWEIMEHRKVLYGVSNE